MKNLLNYIGGKSTLSTHIVKEFPSNYRDLHYIEPFAGGLAVLFRKAPSKLESINDLDKNLFFLYKVVREQPLELKKRLKNTLYSKNEFDLSRKIVQSDDYGEMDKAWAIYVYYSQSIFKSGSCYGIKRKIEGGVNAHLRNFRSFENRIFLCRKRLAEVQIFSQEGVSMIKRLDRSDSLFYIDPPYPEFEQKYIKKYSMAAFNTLLKTLRNIKGKFVLSCYVRSGMKLSKKWKEIKIPINVHVPQAHGMRRWRTESIIKNF